MKEDLINQLKAINPEASGTTDFNIRERQVEALYRILSSIYGADKLVLRAGKMDSLELMRSKDIREKILCLQKLVYGDPTLEKIPEEEEIPNILEELQQGIAALIARRSVEEDLEQKINDKMQEKHEEYLKDLKMQILQENSGPENAATLKRLAILEKQNQTELAISAMELLRPRSLDEIVGQGRAVNALAAKLAAPYPQHIILYGPPGVGKTSAARLAFQEIKKLTGVAFAKEAPFVEVDGTTIRWDPREVTNPLLGSVHDPIYQGARRDFADTGVPEPKLGLVTKAHGGVLFIDEIGELDPLLQNKLLKVLEDKKVYFDSPYYDPDNPAVPQYIKKIFEEGAPADFIMVGATTKEPEHINNAIRSRCLEIFFEPLTIPQLVSILKQAAVRLQVSLEEGVPELIADYTIDARKANNILAGAYALIIYQNRIKGRDIQSPVVTRRHVLEVLQTSRLSPLVGASSREKVEVGKIYALGVSGFIGSTIEIESVCFPSLEKGKGKVRFNETAGSMTKDSFFNATSLLRRLTDKDAANYDLHVNVVGGARIDGPSAGLAIVLAIISAVEGYAIRQDVAVTGEVSIQGKVKGVGGVPEKIYGAKYTGLKKVLVPYENRNDVPSELQDIEVIPVSTVEEAFRHVFVYNKQRKTGEEPVRRGSLGC